MIAPTTAMTGSAIIIANLLRLFRPFTYPIFPFTRFLISRTRTLIMIASAPVAMLKIKFTSDHDSWMTIGAASGTSAISRIIGSGSAGGTLGAGCRYGSSPSAGVISGVIATVGDVSASSSTVAVKISACTAAPWTADAGVRG